MEIFIKLTNKELIPNFETLKKVMWIGGSSVSMIGNDEFLKEGEEVSLSWDKWINDKRWAEHLRSKEYIYFLLNEQDILRIEIDDEALFVDKRAVFLVAEFIARTSSGKIKVDGEQWLSRDEFINIIKDYSNCTFEEAVEKSLK